MPESSDNTPTPPALKTAAAISMAVAGLVGGLMFSMLLKNNTIHVFGIPAQGPDFPTRMWLLACSASTSLFAYFLLYSILRFFYETTRR